MSKPIKSGAPVSAAGSDERDEALRAAWTKGWLAHLVRPYQRELYDFMRAPGALVAVANCARRYGKTTIGVIRACEDAIANPGWQIRYSAPTAKALRGILRPTFRQVLSDCPKDLRPKYHAFDDEWRFPNGSVITMSGSATEEHCDRQRGTAAHRAYVEEAGACKMLQYLVSDVLLPQCLTTSGYIVLVGTPPRSPGHPFNTYIGTAEIKGGYIRRTVEDNSSLTPELVNVYAEEVGGKDSPTWKREYMAIPSVDPDIMVIPEFTAAMIVEEDAPEYYFPLVAMDVGLTRDRTAILFGWYNYREATLHVAREVYLQRTVTGAVAESVKAVEAELWPKPPKRPIRVSDIEPILLHDLNALHDIVFSQTAKDNKDAQINTLRSWIRNDKVTIDPRCVELILDVKQATWNKAHNSYERDKRGHFDGLDALLYMARNAPTKTDPYPVNDPSWHQSTHHFVGTPKPERDALRSIFGRKTK